ncbi:hypothetical protein CRI93_11010 [Longimonas halophila]|uniref:Uncharacterized protein n=1 Tax=Longimonas halophila TaxID=1469170 RepID=A0A2H3NMK0_9BACT|nr:hypothetical protein [Longimonas halophila]PEN06003.1 hypothetical protein CRI93_11010 [Longimonas halophila]
MRHYSEQEIQAIFRRATERQEATDATSPRHGLTLDELKAIGSESGIAPSHIEAAARDIEQGRVPQKPPTGIERFYGMPATVHAERVLPGRMDDTTWGYAIDTLRSVFNTRGQAETIGPIREWKAFTSSGFDYQALLADDTWYTMLEGLNLTDNKTRSPVHVEVKPKGDDTRISMTYQMPASRLWEGPGVGGAFLLAAIVTSVVFAVNGLPLALFLVPLGLLVGGGGAVAYSYHAHRNEIETTKQRIDKAMERVAYLHAESEQDEEEVHEEVPEDASFTETSAELDWGEQDELDSSSSSAQPRTHRRKRA